MFATLRQRWKRLSAPTARSCGATAIRIERGRFTQDKSWRSSGQASGPVKVPNGLIHDWIGAAFIPGTTVKATLRLVQDYDHHQDIYKPEVLISKLMRHRGNDFEIYLRLLKKKILTVVLDTDHDVQYRCIDAARWLCRSYTTRIAEVENAGTLERTGAASRHRITVSVAAVFLLAISRARRRSVHRMSRDFIEPRRASRPGMDH